jgi:protoporphyrinogen oxidase
LGYFVGGFQAFIDRLVTAVSLQGGQIQLQSPVQAIEPLENGLLTVRVNGQAVRHDTVLATSSPQILQRMAPSLPAGYLSQLARLKSMGAVVLTLALRQPLMRDTYWLNLPARSPDKRQNDIPFLALVEHTNYIDKAHYGGDHIVYCGDYVTPDHPYLSMSQAELAGLFTAVLPQLNPNFRPDWIRASWLYRASYAQPVPEINHSRHIPALQTPIPNLYFASMSQVYPWDRGTNFAVEIGRRVARLMLAPPAST